MSKLIKLYNEMLGFCSMEADKEGAVSLGFVFDSNDKLPVKIDGKQLYLPLDHNLRNFDPEKAVIFHPLTEYINRGESDIVKMLRNQINVRINYTVLMLGSHLLRILTSPAEHKKLTPEQRELLLQVQAEDPQIIERYMGFVAKRFSEATNRFFTNIYLKKAGSFQGQKHARVGVVQFPVYEIFNESEKELKLKKGDKEIFKNLFNFIFPGSFEKFSSAPGSEANEAYNNFSDNRDAPWLCCLFKTAGNLTERLNYLLELYEEFVPQQKDYLFDMSWNDTTDNFESFDYYRTEIKLIPAQRGNEGSLDEKKEEPVGPTIVALPEPVQAPMAPRAYPPQPTMHDPRYAPQMQAPAANVPKKNADGSINFDDAMQRSPTLAMSGFVATPLTQWQQQQQMQMMPNQGYPMMHGAMMGGWGGMPPGMMPQYQDPRVAPSFGPAVYTGMAPGMQQQMQMPWGNRNNIVNI